MGREPLVDRISICTISAAGRDGHLHVLGPEPVAYTKPRKSSLCQAMGAGIGYTKDEEDTPW